MNLQQAKEWAHRAEPAEVFIGSHPRKTQDALWVLVEAVERLEKENLTIVINASEIAVNQEKCCKELQTQLSRYEKENKRLNHVDRLNCEMDQQLENYSLKLAKYEGAVEVEGYVSNVGNEWYEDLVLRVKGMRLIPHQRVRVLVLKEVGE